MSHTNNNQNSNSNGNGFNIDFAKSEIRPVDSQNKSQQHQQQHQYHGNTNADAAVKTRAEPTAATGSTQPQLPPLHLQQQQQQLQHVEVLLNNFQIKKKRYRVLLNGVHLVWERLDAKRCVSGGSGCGNCSGKCEVPRNGSTTPTASAAANNKETEYETEQLARKAAYGNTSNVVHTNEIIRVDKSDSPKTKRNTIGNNKSNNNNKNNNYNNIPTNTPPVFTITATTHSHQTPTATTPTTLTPIVEQPPQLTLALPPTEQYLIIHYAERIVKSRSDCNRWRVCSLTLYNADAYIVRQWHTQLNALLAQYHPARVQRLLVFINPYGGRKQALQKYERYCKPLFELVGIDATSIISQRANQIRDILMTHDLTPFDAVCCVGGDGTVAEVINGLLGRTLSDLQLDPRHPAYIPKPRLPIALIPAGSTDTIAYSVHGTEDARTAAIHLVLGQRRGLDVCSVRNSEGIIRFCASVLSYGYLGDVARRSEAYRWMGTTRYEYAGVQAFLMNRGYEAELRMLDPEEVDTNGSSDALSAQSNDTVCYVNCQRCSTSIPEHTPSLASQQQIDCIDAGDTAATALQHDSINIIHDTQHELEQLQQQKQQEETVEVNDCDRNLQPVVLRNKLLNSQLQNDDDDDLRSTITIADAKWKVIKGKFFMINGANITCACSRSPNGISRYNHLSDGFMELILVRSTTHFNNLRFLINTMGHNGDIRRLPFVEVYRTKRFTFRTPNAINCDDDSIRGSCQPIVDSETTQTSNNNSTEFSSWNCDGEVVTDLDIVMSSHCQLIDVFMRGPYAYNKPQKRNNSGSNNLCTCCCPTTEEE